MRFVLLTVMSLKIGSSSVWCCVVWLLDSNILEELATSIFFLDGRDSRYSEMFVSVYQTTWCHSLEDLVLDFTTSFHFAIVICVLTFRSGPRTGESWLHMFSQHFTPGTGILPCCYGLVVHASK
jgi:hypothetical protein